MESVSVVAGLDWRREQIARVFLAVVTTCLGLSAACACQQPAFAQRIEVVSVATTNPTQELIPEPERKQAPDFTLVDNEGKEISLRDYRGKTVLLDFWATWCGGCKLEIPWYIEFDRKYRRHGLAVIGVSMDEKGWEAVRPFLAKKRDDETGGMITMQYPIVIGNDVMAKRFGLTSMPLTLLIDKDGRIAVSHTGVVNKDAFEGDIRRLLK